MDTSTSRDNFHTKWQTSDNQCCNKDKDPSLTLHNRYCETDNTSYRNVFLIWLVSFGQAMSWAYLGQNDYFLPVTKHSDHLLTIVPHPCSMMSFLMSSYLSAQNWLKRHNQWSNALLNRCISMMSSLIKFSRSKLAKRHNQWSNELTDA